MTIAEVLAVVEGNSTRISSVVALIDGLKTQVADFLSGASVSPAIQAGVDSIFAAATGNQTALDAALAANVPPVEPPVEPTSRRR